MSWNYLPEPGEESTAVCCSDTLPFALLKSLRRTASCFCSDSATESCRDSRYGTTFERSTDCRGAESSIASAEDSLVPTSVAQEKEQESTASSPGFGGKWRASFAKFDRDSSSWRTVQCSLLGDSDECSVIWPRAGMTVGGHAYPLPIAERCTREIGFGFWQTPVADDCVERKHGKFNSRGEPKLSAQVKMIPTPRANDSKKRGNFDATNPRNGLVGFVRIGQEDGQLNPDWEEWLMGWPIGSTAFSPLEMARFHEFMQQHGGF